MNKNKYTSQQKNKKSAYELPASIPAEKAVLSSLLMNDEASIEAFDIITHEDFYVPMHATIFKAMHELFIAKKRIDHISVEDMLKRMGVYDGIGGALTLVTLQEEIPNIAMLSQNAQIVKDKAVLRAMINLSGTIMQNCYKQNDKTIDQVIEDAEKTILSLAQKRTTSVYTQIDIWLRRTFKNLSHIKSNEYGITGIPAGFRGVDETTAGFQRGDLIVLAGRPSMGKTAFALSTALQMVNSGFKVGIASLEMSAEQLTLRLLSSTAQVPLQNIRRVDINSDQWVALTQAASILAEKKLFIDDSPMQSLSAIKSNARRLKKDHAIDVLFIDYLQLITTYGRYESRNAEIADISRSLKALAKELDIPVIALAQLSRKVESRIEKKPILSDLRDSGAIEQDADVIMFLYRDVVYNPDTEHPDTAEVIIAKHRNGPIGTALIHFERHFSHFSDYSANYSE